MLRHKMAHSRHITLKLNFIIYTKFKNRENPNNELLEIDVDEH